MGKPRTRGYVSRGEADDGLETWLLYVLQLDDDAMTLERVRQALLDMADCFGDYPMAARTLAACLDAVDRETK